MKPASPEQAVFAEALQCDTPEARAAYLAAACGTDTALRGRVEALLRAAESAGDFLEQPPTGLAAGDGSTLVVTELSEKPGDRIGRYKLLQQIGEGGCGVVYMAEQEEPVRRRVALKVIKLGMDTKSVIARFEAERQALALMDHPNIAKVLDAGATGSAESEISNLKSQIPGGRPYFVMELVRGIKITDYCDQNNLSTEERLKLFMQVCQAIQHAHQKGIIHRDIKPSNILVTISEPGSPGCPKVIDFGIAKATTGQRLTDKTVFTAFEQFIGTPAYMSPEQAMMTSLDIDTRTDIYALGVLLYELLTGQTPFDAKDLMAAGLDAMRRIIREQEPARPSTRLSTMLAADLTIVAGHRHAEPGRLGTLLRGDLDWIVMKALEKDRTRRYETANGLAMDIQRHLENEPVVARPPSTGYRFQKLVRRNKLAFAAASAVAAALIIGLGLSTWLFLRERVALKVAAENALRAEQQAQRAERSRQQAEANEKRAASEAAKSQQVAQFMKDMMGGVGPSVALGRDTTLLREILDRTAERIGKHLTNQPEVEVELRAILALTYEELALFKQREEMARGTLRVSRSRLGEEHPAVADALHQIGDARSRLGDQTEAEKFLREAVALKRKVLGNEHPSMAASLNVLAWVVMRQNKFTEAEMLGREALGIRRKLFGNEHRDVADSTYLLAMVLDRQGKLTEAETLHREALAMERKVLGEEHPKVAESLYNLAVVLRRAGKLAEAETMHREALARRRKLFSHDHPEVAESLRDLAVVLRTQGKLAEAEPLFREAIERAEKAVKADPQNTHRWHDLGESFFNCGEWQAAIAAFEKCNQLGSSAWQWFFMAMAHWQLDKQEEAQKWFYKSIGWMDDVQESSLRERQAEAAALLGLPDPWERSGKAATYFKQGNAYEQQGEMEKAREAYGQVIGLYETLVADFPMVPAYRRRLVDLLTRTGRQQEVEKVYRQAESVIREELASRRKLLGNEHSEVAATLHDLAVFLRDQGKLPEAEILYREELALKKKLLGNVHREVDHALVSLAEVLQQESKLAEAESVWREELAMERKLSGDEHPFVATSLDKLASVLREQRKLVEAEAANREALAMRRKLLGDGHRDVASSLSWLGATLSDQGKHPEAEAAYREALTLRRKLPADEPQLAGALAELTRTLLAAQKFAEAEPLARECLLIREKKLPDNWQTFNARSMLGGSLLGQKKYAEAEPLLLSGCEGMKQREDKIPAIGKPRVKETLQRIVQLYETTGQTEKAAEWKKKLTGFDQTETEKQAVVPQP